MMDSDDKTRINTARSSRCVPQGKKTLPAASLVARLFSPQGRHARLAVFSYHQVLEQRDPLRPGEPDVREFESDLQIIKKLFNVLPLPEAVSLAENGKLPGRAAAITFDDGYANNLELAAPVLQKAGVSATFFIATGAIETGVMWNDLIIDTVGSCAGSLSFDSLPSGRQLESMKLEKADLIDRILAQLKYLPQRERWNRSREFFTANSDNNMPKLMLTRDAVRELASAGFDIGGHTVSHPILTTIDSADAAREIRGCADWLQSLIGMAPVSFAYPNGIPLRDFDERHEKLVAQSGFELAVSTSWNIATPGFDPFNIPRIGPWWRLGAGLLRGTCRAYAKALLSHSRS